MKTNFKLVMFSMLLIGMLILPMVAAVDAVAIGETVQNGINTVVSASMPVLRIIFGTTTEKMDNIGAGLGMQILVFLLIALVAWSVLKTTGLFGNKYISLAVSAILAIIGIRFLPLPTLQAMALPASAMVAAITLVLPFVVLFFLITKSGLPQTARRGCWMVVGVIVAGLWIYNLQNTNLRGWLWMYPLILVACMIVMFFDGTFHKWFGAMGAEKTLAKGTNRKRNVIVGQIDALEDSLIVEMKAKPRDDAKVKQIKDEIAGLKDTLKDL